MTEHFPIYHAAFGVEIPLDDTDAQILRTLTEKGPLPLSEIPITDDIEKRLERLIDGYRVLRFPVEHDAALFKNGWHKHWA